MELSEIKGIGPATLNKLRAMGINSLRELFYNQPARYEDQTVVTASTELRDGQKAMVRGTVKEKPKIAYFHGISRETAMMEDEAGKLRLCWFNEPWMTQQLPLNSPVMLYGTVRRKGGSLVLQNPQMQGIPARSYRKMIWEALPYAAEACPEMLPLTFRERYRLCGLEEALRQIHFPE